MDKTILDLGREIHAISQTGLAFCENPFDIERFKKLEQIASELISKHSDHTQEFLNKIFSSEAGYATPKIDVRSAIFNNGKLLMVREKESNAWTLPGGYVDVNESLSIAAEREVFEESGYQVKTKKVAAIFDHRKHGYKAHLYHFYKIYVICDLIGGEAKTNMETTEVSYFSKEELETISLDPGRITKKHILRMFDHSNQPMLPTDFD